MSDDIVDVDTLLEGAVHLERYRNDLEKLNKLFHAIQIVKNNLNFFKKKNRSWTSNSGVTYKMRKVEDRDWIADLIIDVVVQEAAERSVLHYFVPPSRPSSFSNVYVSVMQRNHVQRNHVQLKFQDVMDLRNPEVMFQLSTVHDDLRECVLSWYYSLHEQFKESKTTTVQMESIYPVCRIAEQALEAIERRKNGNKRQKRKDK